MKMRILCAALAAALATSAIPLSDAFAQGRDNDRGRDERRDDYRDRPGRDDWRGRDEWRGNDRSWRDRDISRFHNRDLSRWRAGQWRHVSHNGQRGWWWVVGPNWYLYPQRVNPYPDPYRPPQVGAVPMRPTSRAESYYYCAAPRGYYPYVQTCSSGWRSVPAG